MNFGFSEDQDMIRKSASDFVERESSLERVREAIAGDLGYSPDHMSTIAENGWLAAVYPEEYGGLDLGYGDLICIAEEFGRGLIPEPLLTRLLAGNAVLFAGSDDQKNAILPGVADGSSKLTLGAYELAGRFNPAYVDTIATETGSGYVLNGAKAFVPDAQSADKILVTARSKGDRLDREGISLFLVDANAPGVNIKPISAIDRQKRAMVELDEVSVSNDALIGTPGESIDAVEKAIDRATVVMCAEMVGGMGQALKMTVEYAAERVQFGKPIGSFQAVKHKAADMFMKLEMARGSMYYAAMAVDENREDLRAAVSAAKTICSDYYMAIGKEAIQLHGGIGFTDEHNIQLFYKRAQACAVTFGDAAYHRERYAQEKGIGTGMALPKDLEAAGAV